MKHAGAAVLDEIEPLLAEIRAAVPALVEKSTGVFYRRSRAFLHFHEDATGVYADLRVAGQFRRFPATSAEDRAALVRWVVAAAAAVA